MDPVIKINRSEIIAVPAIHNRAVFAREVNSLCSDRKTRPDAIAVELGPQAASEVVNWMTELGLKRSGTWLPCMLGLLIDNRFIHPDLAKSAMNLQENKGSSLADISPDLLKKMLYYSDKFLIALSSTDSIIEALRCAVELGIPAYGIDMDEMSMKPDKKLLVEEPSYQSFDLQEYLSHNSKRAEEMRDSYVDGRREYVMASRLKRLANDHKKILFTGGLAHWIKLKELLSDPEVRPADFLRSRSALKFIRSIIHPSIALAFMDYYPVMSTIYEKFRHSPREKFKSGSDLPDPNRLCRKILDNTYEEYHREYCTSHIKKGETNCLERIPDFELLLTNISLVRQHHYLSMSDMLDCSDAMMPDSFSGLLVSGLMNIDRSWASPQQFPGLPLLSMMNGYRDLSDKTEADHFRLSDPGKGSGGSYEIPGFEDKTFTIQYQNSDSSQVSSARIRNWADDPFREKRKSNYYVWVWPPCEALIFGTAYEASRLTRTRSDEPASAVFEGSLFNGLDIKATLRSVINGEKKIMIKKSSSEKKLYVPEGKQPEPTVFIFNDDKSDQASRWSLLIAGTNLRKNVRNSSRIENIIRKYGSCFISSISRVRTQEIPQSMRGNIDSLNILDGYTVLGNPCINARQAGQWLEDNDYKCCPVMPDTSITSLIRYYKKHFNLELSVSDWTTTLIRIAIPYARERFVVIGPKAFKIHEKLNAEARKRNISIDFLPLSYFSESHVSEMRRRILLSASDPDGLTYSPEAEKAIGQKADKYFELLPLYMQLQLKKQINN